jgi:plasmid stabilization system protein ParE
LALAELDEILGYVAARSPRGATNVVMRFRHALDLIGRHPLGAEVVEQRPGVRRLPLVRFPYAIYYDIGYDEVTVLRIISV